MSLGFLLFLCRARFLGGTLKGLLVVVEEAAAATAAASTNLVVVGWGDPISKEDGGPNGSFGSSILFD
jgi:hypothetical protein